MSPDEKTRVLLADSHGLVRAGLRALVNGQPDLVVVGEVSDGAEAVRLADIENPDVLLMDIGLPKLNGLAAARQIMSTPRRRPLQILIVTMSDHDEHIYGAFEAGASGFVLKDTEPEQLIHAVRAVAAGEAALSPRIARRLISALPVRTPLATHGIALNLLTARELEVLRLIAAGLANEEIAHHLVIALATAKTHVSRVLTKLGARDRAQLVRLAYESGLVRPQTDQRLSAGSFRLDIAPGTAPTGPGKQGFRLPSTRTRGARGLTMKSKPVLSPIRSPRAAAADTRLRVHRPRNRGSGLIEMGG